VRPAPLAALLISVWVRDLADRDVKTLSGEALGPEAALSKSTASRICQQLRVEFEVFRHQELERPWRLDGPNGADRAMR